MRRLAILTLLVMAAACASPGPPTLGPAYVSPEPDAQTLTQTQTRQARLIAAPLWVDGPEDMDFAFLAARVANIRTQRGLPVSADLPSGSVDLECRVTDQARLIACAPVQSAGAWTPQVLWRHVFAMGRAYEMRLEPLDADGSPVSGGRVRLTVNLPEVWPEPSDDVFESARLLAQPSAAVMTGYYPQEALEQGFEADVLLTCVVSEAGVNEGCDVLYESAGGHGFGQASAAAYRHVPLRPEFVNGVPRRSMVIAPVLWRLG